MGLLPKRMRKNPVSAASSAPSFAAMIERINSVKASDVAKLSEPRSVSPAMRLSLATFLEEWTESDVGHEKYLDNLLSGFEDVEALKMGDLLEWMAIGTDDQFENEVSLPKGVDHKELVVLHAELLDFLPLKSYNTFTMISLLEDDPELVEEVFNNYIELTATEHDALQALTTIVKRGSIESIRLLLEASPKYEDEGYGFTQTKNYGTLLVDTFELCRRAAAAYKDGNYIGSKALLDQLYDEKGINPQLIRMDLSKMAPMTLRIKIGDKLIGPGDLVLASPMYSSFDKKQLVDAATSKEAGKAEQSKKIVQFDQWKNDWKALIFTVKGNDRQSVRILGTDESDAKKKLNKLLGNANSSKTADDIMNSDVTYDLEIISERKKFEGRNHTIIKKITAVSSDEEEDTEEDMLPTGDESAEKPAITKYEKVLTEADILELLHLHGSTELSGGGGGGGGNNNEKAKPIGCNVSTLMTQIYGNNIRQDSSATFTIHAILKTGGKKDERKMSGDLIPKGTVTFSANREGKTNSDFKASFAMVIEMLPSHEVERKEVLRTTVDPLDKAISGTEPETRRNPIVPPLKASDRPRFTHRYYPATMKKYRKDAPWVFPGQTMSGHGVEMFREATQGMPGQNIQNNELYFDMQMDGRPHETDVYVEDGSRFRYIGTIKSVQHRGKLGESPKNNPPSALECNKCGAQPGFDELTTVRKGAKHPFTGETVKSQVLIHAGCGGNLRGVKRPKNNPKGPGKKRTSAVGNTYAIDLIPRSSVSLTAKSVKFSNKLLHKWRDSSAEMKAFWKKYTATGTGGGNTVYVADETFKTKYFRMKKGQKWNPNSPPLVPEAKDELKEMLEKSNTDRKKWIRREMSKFVKKGKLIPQPGSQQTKQTGDSYVTYKGGKVSMRMILAKHKTSGSFVPYRLLVPAAALRMEGNTLVPRSGSADAKGAKQLLSLIEDTFGKITFHKNMGKGGLKVGRINVDEGVAKVFKTGGLKTEGGAVARPYLYDDKRLTYIAKGRQYTMELA